MSWLFALDATHPAAHATLDFVKDLVTVRSVGRARKRKRRPGTRLVPVDWARP
ncbi:MAG: hypothetical protein IT294_03500 [Deltaproteobacteria bacterium]|nr:hypothetical protein [Deltaproteobacteria bacterium]